MFGTWRQGGTWHRVPPRDQEGDDDRRFCLTKVRNCASRPVQEAVVQGVGLTEIGYLDAALWRGLKQRGHRRGRPARGHRNLDPEEVDTAST